VEQQPLPGRSDHGWHRMAATFERRINRGVLSNRARTSLPSGARNTNDVPSAKCFGFVQTYDEKPRRRLWELMKSQGMQENQQVAIHVRRRAKTSDAYSSISSVSASICWMVHIMMR